MAAEKDLEVDGKEARLHRGRYATAGQNLATDEHKRADCALSGRGVGWRRPHGAEEAPGCSPFPPARGLRYFAASPDFSGFFLDDLASRALRFSFSIAASRLSSAAT